tara:strand:- start:1161 stop:2858 length:1698 start_codon:yes stop_codon:yes gene_type:complete
MGYGNSGGEFTPRDKLMQRWMSLKNERSTWDSHWREISDYMLPRSGRFFSKKVNDGGKVHNNIYDNTGTMALRTLAAGMMAGMTSPARPWFRLATQDEDLMDSTDVKLWLHNVTRLMLHIFSRSNTYRSLHSMYEELGAFGTGASIITADFNTVIHHHPLTIGEYAVMTNSKGRVDTLYREIEMTVGQLVKEFGIENVCQATHDAYHAGNLDHYKTVIHAIEPREDRDLRKKDNQNMAFKSCYFEYSSTENMLLRHSGFEEFPAVAPRWSVAGGDIYGLSPGMEALGDIKQLQHEQLRKAQGIDYQTKPPMQVPTSMKNQAVNTLPGGITYVDTQTQNAGIRSAFEVNLNLNYLLEDIQDVRGRIRGGFYADLFLMLQGQDTGRMTATEVAERHEEKLLMLGPVLERLHNELLQPLIDVTFDQMIKAGVVPPPPPELNEQNLDVEFVSMLSQAQKAVGTNSVDRFVGSLGMVAQMNPEVLDKFNTDEWADAYSDMLGVDPNLITSNTQVARVREARAEQQQAAMQAEQMNQGADTAQKLAGVPTRGGQSNAGTDIMDNLMGYTGV